MTDFNEYIDYILGITESIEKDKCTILTGFNGSGKSLIRKQLTFKIGEDIKVRSVSMQLRTDSNPLLGALSTFAHDTPWLATSESTYNLIQNLLDTHKKKQQQQAYLVIDEPEIGMSYEMQKSIAKWLKKEIMEVLPNTRGIMIITHSKYIVEEMKDISNFVNLNMEMTSISAEEWLNRKIEEIDLEQYEKWTTGLCKAVNKRSNQNNI